VLLASAIPAQNRGCEVLRPLWTEEAVHRALGFMRLVDARKRRGQSTKQNPIAAELEDFAARDLAVRFRQLQSGAERAIVPCAPVLRDVVTDLGVVFACPANIALKTKIDRVSLPAYNDARSCWRRANCSATPCCTRSRDMAPADRGCA